MGKHRAVSRGRVKGVAGLGALTVGALAGVGLGAAPPAGATCASFFGIGNGAGCTSTPTTIAIALGSGATASGAGLFGLAFATGTGARALLGEDLVTDGKPASFVTAIAIGPATDAYASGLFSTAIVTSREGLDNTWAISDGTFALSANFAGPVDPANAHISYTRATGLGTGAINLLGSALNFSNVVDSSGLATSATSIGGDGNVVEAQRGPLSVAMSIRQTGQNSPNQPVKAVRQTGPGININNRWTLPPRLPQSTQATKAAAASAATPDGPAKASTDRKRGTGHSAR